MKVKQSDDTVRAVRRGAYLSAWPIEAQLEALTDASNGDDTKLKRLMADIAKIKDTYPK